MIHNGSRLWKGSALVLAPRDEAELAEISEGFDTAARRPRTRDEWGCADTHRPGVFMCDPAVDTMIAGMAAAARAAAWLGTEHTWPEVTAARVYAERCRGCGDCELVCEFGAIQLQEVRPLVGVQVPNGAEMPEGQTKVAWIDPAICRGGGICAARCPAGAIVTGHPSSNQIEAMLEAILS